MEHAHSTTPIRAASKRVRRGNTSSGASHIALMKKAWRKPLKPEVPLSWISSWVMPEKYQKNTNSQPRPAQSKPFADLVLRSNIAIQRSNPVICQSTRSAARNMGHLCMGWPLGAGVSGRACENFVSFL
jgi:hypothetical protein